MLTLPEVVNEDEAAGGAGPPILVKEEVAEAVINGAAAVELVGLGLMGGGANDEIGAEVNEMAEEADLVAGGGVGIVAGGILGSIDVFIAFVVLDVNDHEITTGFGGGDVVCGGFFYVEIGAGGGVGGVAAGGKVVGEQCETGAINGKGEWLGGFSGGGAAAYGIDAERVVEVKSGESGFIAAILVVVAGELNDV